MFAGLLQDDKSAQKEAVQKKAEISSEIARQRERAAQGVPTYGVTLDVGPTWPADPPRSVKMGLNTVGRNMKDVETGISDGLKSMRREGAFTSMSSYEYVIASPPCF